MPRITITLDDELYRAVKRKAAELGRPMRTLFEEALCAYLGLTTPAKKESPKFGVYNFRIRGSLRREEIYKEHIEHKYPTRTAKK